MRGNIVTLCNNYPHPFYAKHRNLKKVFQIDRKNTHIFFLMGREL